MTYVVFAETYSQTAWLGMKHAKQGGVKIRVETYMGNRWRRVWNSCYRVWTLSVGNKKPLRVWGREQKGQNCDV